MERDSLLHRRFPVEHKLPTAVALELRSPLDLRSASGSGPGPMPFAPALAFPVLIAKIQTNGPTCPAAGDPSRPRAATDEA